MNSTLRFVFLLLSVLCFAVEAVSRGKYSSRISLVPAGLAFFVGTFLWDAAEAL